MDLHPPLGDKNVLSELLSSTRGAVRVNPGQAGFIAICAFTSL
jgi:hypothetical protein